MPANRPAAVSEPWASSKVHQLWLDTNHEIHQPVGCIGAMLSQRQDNAFPAPSFPSGPLRARSISEPVWCHWHTALYGATATLQMPTLRCSTSWTFCWYICRSSLPGSKLLGTRVANCVDTPAVVSVLPRSLGHGVDHKLRITALSFLSNAPATGPGCSCCSTGSLRYQCELDTGSQLQPHVPLALPVKTGCHALCTTKRNCCPQQNKCSPLHLSKA